ncbi:MAG: O-antigen ligase family protein [Methanobacterium sp.]
MSKKRKFNRQQENQLAWERIDQWINIVIIATVAVLPLLIHATSKLIISPVLSSAAETGTEIELYASYKFYFLVLVTLILLGLLFIKMIKHHFIIQKTPLNILLFIFASLLLLSLFAAQYKSAALYGSFERREGTLSFLCYILLFFVAINTTFFEHFSRWLKIALGVVVASNLVLELFAFFKINLLHYAWFKSVLIPSLSNYNAKGIISSTLYNPNYVSGFFSALFVFFLIYAFHEPDWKNKTINLLLALACFMLLMAAKSSSGFVALFIASPLIIWLLLQHKKPVQKLIYSGIIILSAILLICLLSAYQPRIYHEAITAPREAVSEISHWNSHEQITTKTNLDSLELPKPGTAPLNGRFYLWEKTLNLIKNHPIFGYGLDTIVYYFPQNDPEMLANMGSLKSIVDKPHSYYLGIAFGAGILALLVLLSIFYFCIRYTLQTVRSNQAGAPPLSAAILAFTAVFLLQWLVNDSNIASSTVFWILNGVAVSIFLKNNPSLAQTELHNRK